MTTRQIVWLPSPAYQGETTMPKGPNGERRPADVIGCAVMVMQIATGEIEDNKKSGRTRSGHAGAAARLAKTTPEDRSATAKKAANARWG